MAKYKGGNYIIKPFDEYGSPLRSFESLSQNQMGSIAEGKELLASGEAASFAVMRVTYNSIEETGRFYPREAK